MLLTRSMLVKGRVQGVNYRNAARKKAEELGIGGTVRNCEDGSVEIIATATPDQLDAFRNWAYIGPALAEVEEIVSQELPLQTFREFAIIR